MTTTSPSQRARELFAAEYDALALEHDQYGYKNAARYCRDKAQVIRNGKAELQALHAIDKALSSPLQPSQEAPCELCADKCRGHSLGHPEEWEPEPGSRAYQPSQDVERLSEIIALDEGCPCSGYILWTGGRGKLDCHPSVPYLFWMTERITVTKKQLSAAIAVWLKKIPKPLWDKFIEHKILAHYKRASLEEVRLDSEIAQHIASEMDKLDWQVTHPASKPLGSPPPYRGA